MLLFSGLVKITKGIVSFSKKQTEKVLKKENITKKEEKAPTPTKKETAPKKTIIETAKEIFVKPSVKEVSLILKADQLVWIRVDTDDGVAFQGNLKPGSSEKWIANKNIKIRVGNLKALQLTVNGQYYGSVGFGVQDLVVDKSGLKIDDKRYQPSA
jgi:hypothetical protein